MAAPDGSAVVDPASTLQSLVLSCNRDGMACLQAGQHQAAFEKLKYAEMLLSTNQQDAASTSLLAVTCNNLGCYYKRVEKLNPALKYLRRALEIEVSLHVSDLTVAGTHLNICAILSKEDKHEHALQHALCALELIRNQSAASHGSAADEYSLLAIAYHNVAAEQAFLRRWENAANTAREGLEIVRRVLPVGHALARELEKSCHAAEFQHFAAIQRKSGRLPGTPKRFATKGTPKRCAKGARGGQVTHAGLPAIPGETPRPGTSPATLVSHQQAEWMR